MSSRRLLKAGSWAKTHGCAQFGRIQATGQMITVLASAIGPLPPAKCHAWTGSYRAVFYSPAGAVGSLGLAAWCARLPRGDEDRMPALDQC